MTMNRYSLVLLLLYQGWGLMPVYAAAPPTDYYLIAVGTTAGSAIGEESDEASGQDACTLRDAVEIVSAGDLPPNSPVNGCNITQIGTAPVTPVYVINLPAGGYTYTLVDVFTNPGIGRDLTLQDNTAYIAGANPADTIIQAAADVGQASNRVFGLFQSTLELINLTVRHGRCTVNVTSCGQNEFTSGGGILVRSASTLTLDNVRVADNFARNSGGGIKLAGGSMLNVLNGSVISGNMIEQGGAFISGGGIEVRNGNDRVLIDASTVSGNYGGEFGVGGGIQNSGTVTIQNASLISANTAGSHGGGIANNTGATLIIDNSTVSGNTSTNGRGGGIYSSGLNASVTIGNSSLIGGAGTPNRALTQGGAGGRGGGVYNDFFSSLMIDNSTVSHNEAGFGGGVGNIATAQISNGSIISDNQATFRGGGIFNSDVNGQLTLDGSVVQNNRLTLTSGLGGGISNENAAIALIVNASVIGGAGNGNSAGAGGGIFNSGANSSMTLDASTVSDNQAGNGGGIYNSNGADLTIRNNATIGIIDAPNTADNAGGGIFNTDSDSAVTVSAATISHNSALFNGGGLFNTDAARLLVENNSIIDGNRTTAVPGEGGGGAIFNEASGATAIIRDSRISNNISAASGGAVFNGSGIFSEASAAVTIENTVLDNNQARFFGGALRNRTIGTGVGSSAVVVIIDSLMSGNSAGDGGGAISNAAEPGSTTSVTLNNTSIGGTAPVQANSAGRGGAIHNIASGSTASSPLTIQNNSMLQGNSADHGGAVWNQTTSDGSIDLIIRNSHLLTNQAISGDGGGLHNLADRGSINVTIDSNSSLSDNQAGARGGAVFSNALAAGGSSNIVFTINTATLRGNSAGAQGGAVYHTQQAGENIASLMTFSASNLERNSAVSGDGIFHDGGTTSAAESCLVENGVGFFNNTASLQDATFSWWGKPDGPSDADGLSGATGSGDGVTQGVDFSGFRGLIPPVCNGQIFNDQFETL